MFHHLFSLSWNVNGFVWKRKKNRGKAKMSRGTTICLLRCEPTITYSPYFLSPSTFRHLTNNGLSRFNSLSTNIRVIQQTSSNQVVGWDLEISELEFQLNLLNWILEKLCQKQQRHPNKQMRGEHISMLLNLFVHSNLLTTVENILQHIYRHLYNRTERE